ncbi:MAG: GPP34 family phosphoprotein [Metallibacterium scheffleri]|jgi:hypothetical protein|uniref:GPP34 family phosphoprotein n=1 Tax=Metallibacterium scheffleri TaxID=993689 RepID=UPI0026ED02F6|nr:GPP34 family phosphoprotein [Metallibacterium scheffleri]MCK9366761.1 GPP34 family phosphoprotein [Metallibacterium scheffleri]
MLLTERLALLLLDPRRGTIQAHGALATQTLFAAALLADLTLTGRLQVEDAHWRQDSALPLAHPLLAELQRALGMGALPPQRALRLARRKLPQLRSRLLDGLARRDLLHRVPRIKWLPRAGHRYPLRSQQARDEVTTDLLRAANTSQSPADYALLLLADTAGLLNGLPPAAHGAAYAALGVLDSSGANLAPEMRALALLRRVLLDQ